MKKQTLTSVKVDVDTFDAFKHLTIQYKFSMQKLVDRAMFLYINEDDFRKKLHNTTNLEFKEKPE